MDDRASAIHCARVYLAEASRRRHSWVNRTFYWWLFERAQKARRQATAIERQGELFA